MQDSGVHHNTRRITARDHQPPVWAYSAGAEAPEQHGVLPLGEAR